MKNSINIKLSAGFGLCVMLLIAVVVFIFLSLQKLDKLYHEAVLRTGELEVTTDAQHIGEDLYQNHQNWTGHFAVRSYGCTCRLCADNQADCPFKCNYTPLEPCHPMLPILARP